MQNSPGLKEKFLRKLRYQYNAVCNVNKNAETFRSLSAELVHFPSAQALVILIALLRAILAAIAAIYCINSLQQCRYFCSIPRQQLNYYYHIPRTEKAR